MYSKNGSLECITCLQIVCVEFAVDLGSCLHHKTPKNSRLCKAGQAVIETHAFGRICMFSPYSRREC
jgi:hypothetical protein